MGGKRMAKTARKISELHMVVDGRGRERLRSITCRKTRIMGMTRGLGGV